MQSREFTVLVLLLVIVVGSEKVLRKGWQCGFYTQQWWMSLMGRRTTRSATTSYN